MNCFCCVLIVIVVKRTAVHERSMQFRFQTVCLPGNQSSSWGKRMNRNENYLQTMAGNTMTNRQNKIGIPRYI